MPWMRAMVRRPSFLDFACIHHHIISVCFHVAVSYFGSSLYTHFVLTNDDSFLHRK